MVHVCFCLHDKTGHYSKFTGTAMASIFENFVTPPPTGGLTIHILHDNLLTTDNRDKFSYLAGRYGRVVEFHNVEELCADKIEEMTALVPPGFSTVGVFYKFLIPYVLKGISKAIYLDSDIIVNLDINELWQIELGDKCLAVIPEILNKPSVKEDFKMCATGIIKVEDYFNSGVLLMNLKSLREKVDIIKAGFKFRSENDTGFFDQDIWNYAFSKQTVKLPVKFDTLVRYARARGDFELRKIFHYTDKSMISSTSDPFSRLWIKYFTKTPWFNAQTICNLFEGIKKLQTEIKTELVQLSYIMSGKKRAFFAMTQIAENVKTMFRARKSEEFISTETPDDLQKVIASLKKSRGKKVFFIFVLPFELVYQVLTEAGFVYGEDFINGFTFLSQEQGGVPINSYKQFVSLM